MNSVSASAPRIGFDRFLALDWVSAAMRVRAGIGSREELVQQLDEAGLTPAIRKKTLTVLNRLWLEPRDDLADFGARGLVVWQRGTGVPPVAFAWAISLATYPYFGKVVELIGRLTALQGDCRASEVHRRMEEVYGQRDGIRRATNMVLQTLVDWCVIERAERGQKILRREAIRLNDDRVIGWLLESALLYAGRAVPAASAGSMAVLYPFALERPLAMVITQADQLELRYHGPGEQLLGLRH